MLGFDLTKIAVNATQQMAPTCQPERWSKNIYVKKFDLRTKIDIESKAALITVLWSLGKPDVQTKARDKQRKKFWKVAEFDKNSI